MKRPVKPTKPKKPVKEYVNSIQLESWCEDYESYTIEHILNVIKQAGCDIKDCYIYVESVSYDCHASMSHDSGIYCQTVVPNENYNKELEEYQIRLSQYDLQLTKYESDIKKYNKWKVEQARIHNQKERERRRKLYEKLKKEFGDA